MTLPRFAAFLTTLFAATLLVGCGLQPGDTLVQYKKGTTGDRIVSVPANGQVELVSGTNASPEIVQLVEKGDEVGFRDEREDGGDVMAVAGNMSPVPIKQGTVLDRTYYWKLIKSDDE